MAYKLGLRSKQELQGVHPDLVHVVEKAILITKQDFSVHDGLRTESEQAMLVHKGASRTMNSKHRVQDDGYGHAVDLVPYINGKLRWEWGPLYTIAEAMKIAAEEHRVRLRWGGHWGELTRQKKPPHVLVRDYVDARKQLGQSAFIDGPHFEIML